VPGLWAGLLGAHLPAGYAPLHFPKLFPKPGSSVDNDGEMAGISHS
jgi:hypothetical protein